MMRSKTNYSCKMDLTNFDKMFNRKAAEYLNANGKKDDDLMEREVRIPEHMLPKKIVLDDDDAKKEKKMVEENEEELGKTIPEQILEAYKNQNYFKALAVANRRRTISATRFGQSPSRNYPKRFVREVYSRTRIRIRAIRKLERRSMCCPSVIKS